MRLLFALLSVVSTVIFAQLAIANDACTIARNGESALTIVVSEGASPASLRTAQMLKDVLGQMSGAAFHIEHGDGQTGIAVGTADEFPMLRGDAGLQLGERFAATDLATRQGYVLHSHARGVHVIGASVMGVVYGGWDLLHRLGYRYFGANDVWEIVPKRADLTITVDTFEKPDFISRHIAGTVTQDWNERNRTAVGYSWRVPMKPYLPEYWQKPLVQNSHNWGAIVQFAQDKFEKHPEYFGLVEVKVDPNVTALKDVPDPAGNPRQNGNDAANIALEAYDSSGEQHPKTELKRVSSKLCVSNPRVRELAGLYAIDYFQKNPDAPSVSMEPTDGSGWCICKGCQAVGPPSERVMLIANAVAESLEEKYPGKYVGILAYHLHANAPSRKAHPRVCVNLATALSGRKSLEDRLTEWSAVCQNLGVYDYLSVMEWHLGMPAKSRVAHLDYLKEKYPWFHSRNVRFLTGQTTGGAWGAQNLGLYVLGRILWDVDEAKNVDAIVYDFLTSAFGDAAEPMRKYYETIDTSQQKSGTDAFFLDRAEHMYAALRTAKRATDDPAVHRRLNQLILYTRYVELFGREVQARKTKDRFVALTRFVRFAHRIEDAQMVNPGVVVSYVRGAKSVTLRPERQKDVTDLSLDEPEPFVHYVDRPITEKDIRAILSGTDVIPIDDLNKPGEPEPMPP